MGGRHRLRVLGWLATGALAGLVGGFLAGLLREPPSATVPTGGGD